MTWTSNIRVSSQGDGVYTVYATVDADSKEDALAGAEHVLNNFATGKKAWIRARPSASSEKRFGAPETEHIGFVRFSFSDQAGYWEYLDEQEFKHVELGVRLVEDAEGNKRMEQYKS